MTVYDMLGKPVGPHYAAHGYFCGCLEFGTENDILDFLAGRHEDAKGRHLVFAWREPDTNRIIRFSSPGLVAEFAEMRLSGSPFVCVLVPDGYKKCGETRFTPEKISRLDHPYLTKPYSVK